MTAPLIEEYYLVEAASLSPHSKIGDVSLDPSLRRAISLIDAKDWAQLHQRLGKRIQSAADTAEPNHPNSVELPLLAELKIDHTYLSSISNTPEISTAYCTHSRLPPNLKIPDAYLKEAVHNKNLTHVTARLTLDQNKLDATNVRAQLAEILSNESVVRLSLAANLRPCLTKAMNDMGIPRSKARVQQVAENGEGTIIGIIDDGCAFAHPDFLTTNEKQGPAILESRIQFLWDQSADPKREGTEWKVPSDFRYGFELEKRAIDSALARGTTNGAIDAHRVYDDVDYPMTELASHGTHVMGIAAGNGRSLMGEAGIATKADLVFVQLPRTAIAAGGASLSSYILDGVMYIFARARKLGKDAVVNISYGGYAGPHDGMSELEMGMDQLLGLDNSLMANSLPAHFPGRAVVVAAGNGFEADCHASGTINSDDSSDKPTMEWLIPAEDPTPNYLEIWYAGNQELVLHLTPPHTTTALEPVPLNGLFDLVRSTGQRQIGAIDHTKYPGNNDNRIVINLNSTMADEKLSAPQASQSSAPAPAGIWKIFLENRGVEPVKFHAWIERDASGGRANTKRQQSHFVSGTADPRYTLGGLATGRLTIAVGAYNSATTEICSYSAGGPTRDGRLEKPEVCAPAEELPNGRGILSSSSGGAIPTSMGGTSAAAPFATGLVALLFQRASKLKRSQLTVNEVREAIMNPKPAGNHKSNDRVPKQNVRQMLKADEWMPENGREKMRGMHSVRTGHGKLDIEATLRHIS